MATKKLLASVALTAGLLGGAAAGVILGAPGVSGAQTTTVSDQPTTTVPGNGGTAPDRENCPDKDGTEGQVPSGSPNSNAALRRGPGRV